MNKCRKTPKNVRCAPEPVESLPPLCDPFEVCLSFGRSLSFDGACVRLNGQSVIADGWYGEVHVVNGCIVDARASDIPVYTPPPCAPAATPCGDGDGGGSVVLSPDAANLTTLTGNQLLTKLYYGPNEGITVSGSGTCNDPLTFRVTASDDSGIFITSGSPDVLSIAGSGVQRDPYIFKLENSPVGAGTYGPFEIDSFGRVTGYNADAGGDGVQSLLDGNGTTVNALGAGVYRVDLEELDGVKGSYTFGGYTVTVDDTGRISGTKRGITLKEGTYTLGNYTVSVNAYGSITKIEKATTPVPPNVFVAHYAAGEASTTVAMQLTTDVPGYLHVEYTGYMGTANAQTPGLQAGVQGITVAVDNIVIPGVVATLVPSGTPGTMVCTGICGTTAGVITAGTHEVVVTGPEVMGQYAALLKCTVVGVGA
ncbi:TPA: hypothetical protein JZG45_003977 [Escherichia coli]|nr:hypothetical protein [Escherichia coli]